MSKLNRIIKSPLLTLCLVALFVFIGTHTAFADLESSIDDLQSKVETISTPLAIIFLIIAGWQKAMGNQHLFIAALIGTIMIFAAPQMVLFISAAFGGA